MRRREFMTLLGSAAAGAWPVTARAQQPKLPRIGVLVPANPEPFWSAFRAGLREHGYTEGRNIQFEFRSADGQPDRLLPLAEELVQLKVDIIVANQTPAVIAARQATREIPIVMAPSADPLGMGLISNLARPGGNITGLSGTISELASKTLELIRDMLPDLRRVAVLTNAADPYTKTFAAQIEHGGRALSIAIQIIAIRSTGEFDAAFAAMAKEKADAVIVQPSLQRKRAAELALKHGLPATSPTRFFTAEGGLMSYSANLDETYRRVAFYIDRVLKGTKPADLPVEQPTKFDLVINLKTARALGISVPPTVLARADEVIE
jgi:putative ABC transport system substrate-binding protein